MTDELVLLECITDNPYQPRTTDNAEHIESLARSGVTLPKAMIKIASEFDAQILAAVAAETEV